MDEIEKIDTQFNELVDQGTSKTEHKNLRVTKDESVPPRVIWTFFAEFPNFNSTDQAVVWHFPDGTFRVIANGTQQTKDLDTVKEIIKRKFSINSSVS